MLLKGFGPADRPVSPSPGRASRCRRWDGPWPAIVKPEAEDASLGIDQSSVVESPEGIVEGVARLRVRHGGDVLIEAYLPGREFNVGVLALPGPKPCPWPRSSTTCPPKSWPILTYAAKWDHRLDRGPRQPGPDLPGRGRSGSLAERLGPLAVEAFRATGCRDYARVDFRLDAEGSPMILEVNPNPDIGPTAGWARALASLGARLRRDPGRPGRPGGPPEARDDHAGR